MENYKPNSYRYKTEVAEKQREKRAEKIVTGSVITKKKSVARKITDEFVSDDAKNVKSYILWDVLIPAAKKALWDIITDGADIILYGGSNRNKKRSTADRVSYTNYSDKYNKVNRFDRTEPRFRVSYDDIILESRSEAEDVITRMDELMDTYGLVRVADLFDLVGKTGSPTDNGYGWTNITSAEVVRVREGYWIKMPRAIPIDR